MIAARRSGVTAAVLAAAAMIGFQTAGKATRDALFLSTFPVTRLPTMVTLAAIGSVLLAVAAARLLTRTGPARLVPIGFASSAAALMLEWAFIERAQPVIAVLFYLHYATLGSVLISGYWLLVNERFEPRSAKRHIGRIVAGGTTGGVLGGVLASRVAATLSVQAMLPFLAVLHLACAWLVLATGRGEYGAEPPVEEGDTRAGVRVIGATPYLQTLLAVVLLTTVAEGLLDWVFKARVTDAFGDGRSYLRVFAWFYTGVALLSVLVQVGGARVSLRGLGPGRTVASLPLVGVLGGAVTVLIPGLAPMLLARGGEAVTRQGLYRAGYELLFAPLAARERRATKALLDVGATRLGDVLAAAVVQAAIMTRADRGLLAGVIGLSLVALVLASRLQRGYLGSLERRLIAGVGASDTAAAEDSAVWSTMLRADGAISVATTVVPPAPTPKPTPPVTPAVAPLPASGAAAGDAEVARLIELRSRDVPRVRAALQDGPLPRGLVGQAITLLAWDPVFADAVAALRAAAPLAVGQLVDHLLDPDEEFAVRRRIPLVLGECATARSVEGLVQGLADPRFEVRYRCGLALSRLLGRAGALAVDPAAIRTAVLREVHVDRGVWEGHRVLDRLEDEEWSPMFDEVLRDRASRGLQHVFTMLALILPREPLQLAYRGLYASATLRGTALEYLEAVIPADIRAALWTFLEDTRTVAPPARSRDDVLRELMESRASIAIDLQKLRRQSR
jgi:hypothetical protein